METQSPPTPRERLMRANDAVAAALAEREKRRATNVDVSGLTPAELLQHANDRDERAIAERIAAARAEEAHYVGDGQHAALNRWNRRLAEQQKQQGDRTPAERG